MAEADIAYVATAGAAGLALAISAWAWRLRKRLGARETEVETWLSGERAHAAACEGGLNVFDDVRLALTPEGAAQSVFGAPEALAVLAPGREGAGRPPVAAIRSSVAAAPFRMKCSPTAGARPRGRKCSAKPGWSFRPGTWAAHLRLTMVEIAKPSWA